MIESAKPINKINANKDVKSTVLKYPTCHPNDTSHKRLQMMFNKTCKEKFKEILNVDECMIAHHNHDNARRLITMRSLKKCEGMENSANYHADKTGIRAKDNGLEIARRSKETLHKDKITPSGIEITNSQLKISGMIMCRNAHNRKIIARQ